MLCEVGLVTLMAGSLSLVSMRAKVVKVEGFGRFRGPLSRSHAASRRFNPLTKYRNR